LERNPTYYTGVSEHVAGTENLLGDVYETGFGLEWVCINKINLVVDVFQDRRKDILIPRQSISSIVGYDGYNYASGTTG